jgi:hypothetical protein
LELLRGVLSRLNVPWDLRVIEGADHSFNVPKSIAMDSQNAYDLILSKSLEWLGD